MWNSRQPREPPTNAAEEGTPMSENVYSNGDVAAPIYAVVQKNLAAPETSQNNNSDSSNIYHNEDTVIYSQLHDPNAPDSTDVYANILW